MRKIQYCSSLIIHMDEEYFCTSWNVPQNSIIYKANKLFFISKTVRLVLDLYIVWHTRVYIYNCIYLLISYNYKICSNITFSLFHFFYTGMLEAYISRGIFREHFRSTVPLNNDTRYSSRSVRRGRRVSRQRRRNVVTSRWRWGNARTTRTDEPEINARRGAPRHWGRLLR